MTIEDINKPERVSSAVFINSADDFLKAATKVCKPSDEFDSEINFVAYYLLCHSIELSLKAFLFDREVKYTKLIGYGHDLNKLIVESQKDNLDKHVKLSKEEVETINQINFYYLRKLLEYRKKGSYSFPKYVDLYEIARKLVAGIKLPVREKLLDDINKRRQLTAFPINLLQAN